MEKQAMSFYFIWIKLFIPLITFFSSCTTTAHEAEAVVLPISIIPQPLSVAVEKGSFIINNATVIVAATEEEKKSALFLNLYLKEYYGLELQLAQQTKENFIQLKTKTTSNPKGAYQLSSTKKGVTIEGDSPEGVFYAVQTLVQLLPVDGKFHLVSNETNNNSQNLNPKPLNPSPLNIPLVTIKDEPRFGYRGMHLDVSRHFFPVSFIKKYIDYIALHKMNFFHWHLTDDQGWRIEIKKYPKLTETGAWREGTIIGRYPGVGNDNKKYGGYYTQQEVKDVVQYAADRFITVIPEIDMPGHASAAIAAYPQLSCTPNEQKKVQQTWGIFPDVLCPTDYTFSFMQDVLDEVMQLFPSKYIHIGGDEAPKTAWKASSFAQQLMKEQKLKNENQLQSYFIQRMEKWVNSKGRTIIGWDEILEGGLAPNAVVMSWRGEKGGIEAAKKNHYVIMTPEDKVYLNWSQTKLEDSVSFGRFTPLEKVYAYEPVPKELPADKHQYILGAQGSVWTEYIKHPSTVEYHIFPRMTALAEVFWSTKEKRNWKDFEHRLRTQFKRYELWNASYSNAVFAVTPKVTAGENGVHLQLTTADKSASLFYKLKGGDLKKYSAPVPLNTTTEVTAFRYINSTAVDSVSFTVHVHKATGKKISINTTASSVFPGEGAATLVDGFINTKGLVRSVESLGFGGKDVEAVIDLGRSQTISNVIVHTLDQRPSWIYHPSAIEVYGSEDGKNYKKLGATSTYKPTVEHNGLMLVKFNNTKSRYIKVVVKNFGTIPAGNPGAGARTTLFISEIEVF